MTDEEAIRALYAGLIRQGWTPPGRAFVSTHDGDEPAILVAASWVIRGGAHQDWACAQCVPHSDVLSPGFQCYYHRAESVLAERDISHDGGSNG